MATNFMIPSMYQNPTTGAAPAQAIAPNGDAANLVTALVTAFGLIANKVAMYALLNKDPSSTTPTDIALFLESGAGDASVVNAVTAGESLQNALLKEVSTQTFNTLQISAVSKGLPLLSKLATGAMTAAEYQAAIQADPALKKFFGV